MKNKYLKKLTGMALIAFLTLAGGSCKKVLDLQPHNSTFTEAYFQTGQDANTAIAGAYALLRKVMLANNSWHIYGDLPAGEFAINGDPYHQPIENGQFTGLNVGSENWNWVAYYQLMQQINLVIKKVPGIAIESFTNPDEKAQIISEAYFLRAFTYFYMSRIWGDVPLKLEPDLDISQAVNISRTPATTVLAQCLADCDRAEQGLVFGYDADPSQTAVRANKGSVLALKAHIQAWKGDYAACEKSADSVIAYGKYKLVDSADYEQIFIGKSSEGIFEINVNYSQSEGQATLNNQDAQWPTLAFPFVGSNTDPAWSTNRPYLDKAYYENDTTHLNDSLHDLRYRTFFFQDQTIKYSNIIYADGSRKNDPRLSNNLTIFRLADIMLLRAEALDTLGRANEAIPLLNEVRERAGMAPYDPGDPGTYPQPLKILILKERLKELFFEGQSYYDLLRTGELLNYNDNFQSGQYSHGGWLWPIDPGMFKDDFTLTQTPYWQGKL
jgi:hypothetical protein